MLHESAFDMMRAPYIRYIEEIIFGMYNKFHKQLEDSVKF